MSLNFFTWSRQKKEQGKLKNDWIIYILLGVLLMVVVIPTGKKEEEKPEEEKKQEEKQSDGEYAKQMEERLEKILKDSIGVGKVSVMITTEDEGESVVNKDISSQEKSVQENTVKQSVGEDEIPYITKQKVPKIKGVVVVAQGADNAVVKKEITEAVMALFDLEIHKVKVLSMG